MNPTNPTIRQQHAAWACSSALLFVLACPTAYAVQDCEFKGQHINTSDGSQTAGKTGMVLCKDRDTGKPEREYELRDGKNIGLSRYFRDGKLVKEFTITANGPHEGLEREWAMNGQLVHEFTNVNGHTRGVRRQWFDDGKPRKVEWVAESERDGAALEYHASSGQLATLRCGPKPLLAPHVDDARLCGFNAPSTVNTYSYKGEVRKTAVLVAGVEQKATTFFGVGQPELEEELQQQGTQKRETYYAAEGGKRREKLWDVSGRPALLLREAEFHASGSLVAERNYQLVVADTSTGRKRSRLASESRFYLNGQPQQKDVYTLEGTVEMRATPSASPTRASSGRRAAMRWTAATANARWACTPSSLPTESLSTKMPMTPRARSPARKCGTNPASCSVMTSCLKTARARRIPGSAASRSLAPEGLINPIWVEFLAESRILG